MIRSVICAIAVIVGAVAPAIQPDAVLRPGVYAHDFGDAVASSNGIIVVGSPSKDRVEVFDLDGESLGSIDAPEPGGRFGYAVAIWRDKILVGAPGLCAAYMYDLNGELVTWVAAPGTASRFGAHLTVIEDKLLLSAPDWRIDLGDGHVTAGILMSIDLAHAVVDWTIVNPISAAGFGSEVVPRDDGWVVVSGSGPYPWVRLLTVDPATGQTRKVMTSPATSVEGKRPTGAPVAVGSDRVYIGDRGGVWAVGDDGDVLAHSLGLAHDDPYVASDETFVFACDEQVVSVYAAGGLDYIGFVTPTRGGSFRTGRIYSSADCVVVQGGDDRGRVLYVYRRIW